MPLLLTRTFKMEHQDKQVSYTSQNSYATLNQLNQNTKNVWLVLHGIGYLSKYFIKYFDALPANENYIIAPQAPSKYYLKNEYKHVGASWLTKENTLAETKNVVAYLDAVFLAEKIPTSVNFIVFGFSQGVSIAARWVAQRQLKCNHLVLYAGGLPSELTSEDFIFLDKNKTKVTLLVGDADQYINAGVLKIESEKIENIFQGKAEQIVFKGGHEIKKELLNQFTV